MRRVRARLLCLICTITLVICMMPSAAFAVATVDYETDGQGNKTKINSIYIDPYTYQDVGDTIGAELDISGMESLAASELPDWAVIANGIFKRVTHQSSGVAWNGLTGKYEDYMENDKAGDAEKIDLAAWLGSASKKSKGSEDHDWAFSTGLSHATNLATVRDTMASQIAKGISGKTTAGDILSRRKVNGDNGILNSMNKTDSTHVYYNIVTSIAQNGATYGYYYNSYGVAFYDFNLSAITEDGVEYTSPVLTKNDDGSNNNKVMSYSENGSETETEVEMQQDTSSDMTISNSIEATKSFTFTQTVGSETKLDAKVPIIKAGVEQTFSVSVSAEEAISTAYTNEKSVTEHSGSSLTATVVLPPHTAIGIEQSEDNASYTLTYDCPVAINFKVAVFDISGYVYDDNAATKQFTGGYGDLVTVFGYENADGGTNAQRNLYTRAIKHGSNSSYDMSYGQVEGYHNGSKTCDRIVWADADDTTKAKVQAVATEIPLSASGASMSIVTKTKNSKVDRINPLYTLTTIKPTGAEKAYSLLVGDEQNLDAIGLEAFDEFDVPFYGFNENKGHWVVCDKNGEAVDDTSIVEVVDDPINESSILKANGAGECYIKWVLDNDVSYKGLKGKEVTAAKNAPASTAIKFRVAEPPTDLSGYRVELEGEPSVVVNEDLNLAQAFEPAVYDDNDQIITRAVTFEAQDVSSGSPVSISGNTFISTKDGAYKVRAVYTLKEASIHSDWMTVKVLPARKLAKLNVTAPAAANIEKTHPTLTYDIKSMVTGEDQYGQAWPDLSSLQYTIPDDVDGASIADGILTVTKPGSYVVSVVSKDDDAVSAEVPIEVGYEPWVASYTFEQPTLTTSQGTFAKGTSKSFDAKKYLTLYGPFGEKLDPADFGVTYELSGSSGASLNNGVLKATAAGTYTITAKVADLADQSIDISMKTYAPVTNLKVAKSKSNIQLSWNKISGADGYFVYGSMCNKPIKKLKTITSASTTKLTIKKMYGKKLNLKKCYLYQIRPYQIVDGKKVELGRSIIGHVNMKEKSKYVNATKVTVAKSELSLAAGKTANVKAKVKLPLLKKQLDHCAGIRYMSTNPYVASVSSKGVVTANAEGSCTVYAYAVDGVRASVQITVK